MRILLVSLIQDNRWSGMGKWSHQIADALRRSGHEPELWFSDQFPGIRRAGRLGRVLFPWVLAGRIATHRRRFDVVVVHEPSGLGYGLLRLVWPTLPPLVLMCHNVESHVFRTMCEASRGGLAKVTAKNHIMFHLVHRPLSDGAIRVADRVVCLSARDWWYLTTRLRRRPEHVFRKLNGADKSFFAFERSSRKPPRVVFVGGWLDVKGRRLLPRIWERVLARFPEASLTVVGTGYSAAEVQADFPPTVRPNVDVIPRVETEGGMAQVYRDHDVFLMPSLTEGSSLALIEAMGGGLVVVAADVGGIPDIVTAGETGLLFASGDAAGAAVAIGQLFADPDRMARLAEAGRRRAAELTWDVSALAVVAAARAAMRLSDAHPVFSGTPGRWPPLP